MSMSNKPLTKALHTVRVIEAIATHLVQTHNVGVETPYRMLGRVLVILGNDLPLDAELRAACVAACAKALQS